MVRQFLDAGIIADHDRHRYEALVASTCRLILNRWVDLAILTLSFTLAVTTTSQHYPESVPSWVTPDDGTRSLAGWWRMVVSQSLFHVLQAIWSWRLLLWVRFLFRTSRLDMNLVASHPDLMGGLPFVLIPLRGFSILAFGIGAIVAGSIAESVLIDGKPLDDYRYLIGAQVFAVLVLFAGPMLFLMGPLIRLQEWGTFHYGRLAADVGHAFQQRWLLQGRQAGSDALEVADFSATTDLYSGCRERARHQPVRPQPARGRDDRRRDARPIRTAPLRRAASRGDSRLYDEGVPVIDVVAPSVDGRLPHFSRIRVP